MCDEIRLLCSVSAWVAYVKALGDIPIQEKSEYFSHFLVWTIGL